MVRTGGSTRRIVVRRTILAAAVALVGLSLSAVGLVRYTQDSGGDLEGLGGVHRPPFTQAVDLTQGIDYFVYEYLRDGRAGEVRLEDVTVIGPDGSSVPIRPPDPGAAVTFGSAWSDLRQATVASFTATESGEYLIEVTARANAGSTGIAVASWERSAAAPWFLVVGVGLFLVVLGGTWLLVVLLQTVLGSAPLPVTTPVPRTPVPAGWYPDPSRPGGQRYWDGGTWTEHQA